MTRPPMLPLARLSRELGHEVIGVTVESAVISGPTPNRAARRNLVSVVFADGSKCAFGQLRTLSDTVNLDHRLRCCGRPPDWPPLGRKARSGFRRALGNLTSAHLSARRPPAKDITMPADFPNEPLFDGEAAVLVAMIEAEDRAAAGIAPLASPASLGAPPTTFDDLRAEGMVQEMEPDELATRVANGHTLEWMEPDRYLPPDRRVDHYCVIPPPSGHRER